MNNSELNFSEVMYMYAERFVSEAGLLQNKEELPNRNKVSVSKLGNLLSEASFAYLFKNNFIELRIEKTKTLGFIPVTKVISSKKSIHPENLTSIESRIFDLSDDLDTHSIMYRLIGDECAVPWGVITQIVKSSLVNKGILNEEKIVKKILVEFITYRYHLNQEKGSLPETKYEELKSYLEEFSKNDFHKLLIKSINSGISAQIERPDNDD
ncbi:MAG: hypothetical protein WC243_03300 [Patescibacteria group bacterium]|jgi:hypothetical protein